MPTNRIPDAPEAVDLAVVEPFALAALTVAPAALRVSAGDWSQRLERRAMQVLVVLARAAPDVVGRGELNRQVWGGRVVGEDAINRAVQTLRRVAADAPAPLPFAIETIPRVGYRLTAAVEGAIARPSRLAASSARWAWRRRAAAAVVAFAAAAVLWWAFGRASVPPVWRIVASAALDDLPSGARDVALSADGTQLAYAGKDASGHERVFVRTAANGGMGAPVSPAGLDARHPAWSPHGARLAFYAYDSGQPCRLYVLDHGRPASSVGVCESSREPHLAWSADGSALLFEDATGWNAVTRITAVRVADGHRSVISTPPGDGRGDDLPVPLKKQLFFQRLFAFADEGWVSRDPTTGRERLLWRRRGVAGTAAAALPDGALAIAWTRAGASGLDFVGANGDVATHPLAPVPVTALSAAGDRLLVETDHSESALARGDDPLPLATVHGRIIGPVLLRDGRLRFPVVSAGVSRIWERDVAGVLRPWGRFVAAQIIGLVPSPDGRLTAAMVTGDAGREVVVFDAAGRPGYRWKPHARSINPPAWSSNGRRLIVPVLDGAGWRLFSLDPFGRARPHNLGLPGYAVVQSQGPALYGVRAGENTGGRELWRLDGELRRLPIDLTLFDIVNWRAVDAGIWLPDRGDRTQPRLVLRDAATGRVLRRVAAPGLAGPRSGLAADARGPVYVRITRDAPEYGLLTLAQKDGGF